MIDLASDAPPRRARKHRSMLVPTMAGAVIAAMAVAAVCYLLWPTWRQTGTADPGRIPVSVGATVFDVPSAAFRIKVQKHSGPQDRVDLAFQYPSLQPPDAPRHVTADEVDGKAQPIDRIFVTISAHNGAMAPEMRARTIYPRYLEASVQAAQDGLSLRAFRDASAYAGEDLASAEAPPLTARCTRDGDTPGMCLSERRVDGADMTFRFPRAWLAQWRDVTEAMDRLTTQLRGAIRP